MQSGRDQVVEFKTVNEGIKNRYVALQSGNLVVAKGSELDRNIEALRVRLQSKVGRAQLVSADLTFVQKLLAAPASAEKQQQDTSEVQKLAQDIFTEAVSLRASDIHIRVSKREQTTVRFRVLGDLTEMHHYSRDEASGRQLLSAIYQAMADVSDATYEENARQDARIANRAKLPRGLDGIRIATTPQVDGTVMVLRLLYEDVDGGGIRELGYSEAAAQALDLMAAKPTGIIIISGPTGSGKSTTLQRVLRKVISDSQGRKHVITVEDPPEYTITGAVQTPVDNATTAEERSIKFQAAIKAAMRLDPDIMMIGETRDEPSAALALQAGMTGHQVWTTLHANYALAAIDRLIDLKLPPEMLCDPTIVAGLVAQRLVKTLCPHCKQPFKDLLDANVIKPRDRDRLSPLVGLTAYVRGKGCKHCGGTGLKGRTVVAEVVVPDQALMALLLKRDKAGAMAYWLKEQKGVSLAMDALLKVRRGICDPFLTEEQIGLFSDIPFDLTGNEWLSKG